MVTVGVTDLADAGAAPLANAGMALPAEPAGAITVGVVSLVDAGMVTAGVADSADTVRCPWLAPFIFLIVRSIVVVLLVVVIGYHPEYGAGRELGFRVTWIVGALIG